MAAVDPERVRTALRTVLFPNFRRDVVTLGMVQDLRADEGAVTVRLRPGTDKADVLGELRARIAAAVERLPGVRTVSVEFAGAVEGRGKDPFAERAALPGVRHVIAVSSAKGGVGKWIVPGDIDRSHMACTVRLLWSFSQFNGYSFIISETGPCGGTDPDAYDINGELYGGTGVLTDTQALILGVYDGPTVTNVPYTVTGCSFIMDSGTTSLRTVSSPSSIWGYGHSTISSLCQIGIDVNIAGGFFIRSLGNVNCGGPDLTGLLTAREGPRYAYAWYDPETGHISNLSPIYQIPKPTSLGANPNTWGDCAYKTPVFDISNGIVSYPEGTSLSPASGTDGRRFSHVLFFRTLSNGGSTFFPIGSLEPYVGKVHVGGASTRGSRNPKWLGLPSQTAGLVYGATSAPQYWYDFSRDDDLLVTAGLIGPQYTNEKPMVTLAGGVEQPGKPYAATYWDGRLWLTCTEEPDKIMFSCDSVQCPFGIPAESFPAWAREKGLHVKPKMTANRKVAYFAGCALPHCRSAVGAHA